MGLPTFYKWLVRKYENVVVKARPDTAETSDDVQVFDNLYLDLNGLIHPCFHPHDDNSTPATFEEASQALVPGYRRGSPRAK
ncbi:hypothetical protein K1719_047422 [Acacia pycnantha]|nr:hypothetical protein K1719_047422 [Acacia pycnantha]